MTEQHFTTPRPVQLKITIPAGDVEVATVDGDESTVTLTGSPDLIEATSIELIHDRLVIEQRRRPPGGFFGRWNESLHVHACIPRNSGIEIATTSGDASLEGTFAGLEMTSASGDVVVVGELAGDASVKTASGDVRLSRLAGDLIVRTVSGDVAAETVGGSVWVKSVSGDLRIGSLRAGKVTVQGVSGNTELGIAPGSSVEVDAGSVSGNLRSDIPLSADPASDSGPAVTIRSSSVSGDFHVFRAT